MTKEEAKKAADVMLAYAGGSKIEYSYKDEESWSEISHPEFNWYVSKYRIKQEPKYRPFNSVEECWWEMQKHQPFGWIKTEDDRRVIAYMDVDGILTGNDAFCTFEYAIKHYTFDDGTPFGVKEEEG